MEYFFNFNIFKFICDFDNLVLIRNYDLIIRLHSFIISSKRGKFFGLAYQRGPLMPFHTCIQDASKMGQKNSKKEIVNH